MIKLNLIANVVRDAVVNTVSGKTVINFTVAHSEKYHSVGEQKEKTTYVECAWWTDKTTVSQYIVKGKMIYVEGTPEAKSYTKKDGSPGVSLILRINNLELLSKKEEKPVPVVVDDNNQDDLPF